MRDLGARRLAGGIIWATLLVACPGDLGRTVPGMDGGEGGLVFPDGVGPAGDGPGTGDQRPGDVGGPTPDATIDGPPCSSFAEKLDGKDNNCNGKIDEGFWATPLTVAYQTLTQKQSLCTTSTLFSDYCTSGANRHCQSLGYVGGFGPVEYGPSSGTIVCLADATVSQATFTALNAQHSSCTASAPFSLFCNSAIHRTCSGQGATSGVGPVEHSATSASIICVKHAKVRQVSFATLAAHHSGCTASKSFWPDCQAAINRYCAAQGHATGLGPVEQNVDAYVACLDAK